MCTPICTYNVCGDGYVGAGEDCDGDVAGCVDCQLVSCGNGVLDPDEECDDGNLDDTDACLGTCKNATCGDSFVQNGVEACDDGNDLDTDACVTGCKPAACGDGLKWEGTEFCDDGNLVDDDDCPNSCGPPGCGDGVVSPGEECDDGNLVSDDGCTNACKNPVCGDSIVQAGEECDNGVTQNADNAACTLACENNVCGDGKVNMGVEQCDDGNDVESDDCLADCKLATCGDGILHLGEEDCDHGTHNDNNDSKGVCNDDCSRSAYLVFVSSKLYIPGNSDFGSIEDADARCGELAASDLGWLKIQGGNWKAWLGDGNVGPGNNFHKSSIPYYTLKDTTTHEIADSWTDLTDQDIITGIDITDTNQELLGGQDCSGSHVVWTGIDGNNSFAGHCDQWTSADMGAIGRAGSVKRDDGGWTDACDVTCDKSARIYCFEQP
ncbi:DUF4215 domain-containing protein [Nannocystis punicea]|uniref:DUF4215 domain-containing protein n=1 Tax=Nannocystis punicea TaxID=2995304 RepID=A0ABY7H1S8_9BACT|nr:DUF4215 domain-containing protein [Nannocystis poenicansa]WAS93201.1 DUF4215 domain-containing protein [Nannocystis poenicansa]